MQNDYTDLHHACLREDVERMLQYLNFDTVNAQDGEGHTPLMVGCQVGNLAVVELLLQNGADVHISDDRGRTALHWASLKRDQPDLAGLLIKHGADPNATSSDGLTPLHYAAILGFAENARILLREGADTRVPYTGKTASELAQTYGHPEVAELIPKEMALLI